MAGNLKLLAGLAAGYVLGARAGRERYEQIAEAGRRLAERPEIRELTGKVRAGLGTGLERAAGTASDRLQQVRGEDRSPGGQPQAETGGPRVGEPPEHRTTEAPWAEAGEAGGETREGSGGPTAWPPPSVGLFRGWSRCPPWRCVGDADVGGSVLWPGRRPRPWPRRGGLSPRPGAASRSRPGRSDQESRETGGDAWQAT